MPAPISGHRCGPPPLSAARTPPGAGAPRAPEAAALAGAAADAIGDDGPVLGAVLLDQLAQQLILLRGSGGAGASWPGCSQGGGGWWQAPRAPAAGSGGAGPVLHVRLLLLTSGVQAAGAVFCWGGEGGRGRGVSLRPRAAVPARAKHPATHARNAAPSTAAATHLLSSSPPSRACPWLLRAARLAAGQRVGGARHRLQRRRRRQLRPRWWVRAGLPLRGGRSGGEASALVRPGGSPAGQLSRAGGLRAVGGCGGWREGLPLVLRGAGDVGHCLLLGRGGEARSCTRMQAELAMLTSSLLLHDRTASHQGHPLSRAPGCRLPRAPVRPRPPRFLAPRLPARSSASPAACILSCNQPAPPPMATAAPQPPAAAAAARAPSGAERLLRAAVAAGVEVCFANPGTAVNGHAAVCQVALLIPTPAPSTPTRLRHVRDALCGRDRRGGRPAPRARAA